MRFQVLGPLEVIRDGERIPLGGPKQRLVLAHLLIRANELVSADALIDEIWGEEPPEAARSSLHSYVSHLKKALGPERLVSRPPGYVLTVASDELDAARFETLADQARRRLAADPAAAARTLRDALELWRGEPFADLATELSLAAEIERLSEMRLSATEDRFEAEMTLGRHAELVPELERLVARHPLRERLAGQLMLALYRAGRQAEALAVYHRLRTTLDEELGLEPSPAIEHLQAGILNHDPSLELAGAPLRGYRLVEQIGAGPLGVVHRAFEPQTEREVAIKVLSPAVANDADFVRRFEADARRIARIEHPHVVPLLDWWREPDAAYVVMPLLRGGTLTERLDTRQMGSQQALRWAEQLAGALDAAHRQGVVHGDLRPANVLFDVEGNAYLSDFLLGIDTATGGHEHGAEDRYLAPERRLGQPPSVAADVYALGTITLGLLEATSSGIGVPQSVVSRARSTAPEERPSDLTELVTAVRRALLEPRPDDAVGDASSGPTRNPYKGLRPFEEADAPDFHGREELVGELVEQMRQGARLLAVVGPSGSGKSSVVNAGLVPAVRSGGPSGSRQWYVAQMTPGDRPFDKLEEALTAVAIGARVSPAELLATRAGLGAAVARILPDNEQLVLVIDQFEELFTLVTDEEVRQSFLTLLGRTMDDQSARLRTVITLRADFYDRPLRHELFGRFLAKGTVPLPPLTPEGLARAVAVPARQSGLELDDGLVARLVSDMTAQPASLPLLQYALTELWERRDGRRLSLRAYDASGGIGGAIARRSDQLVRDLDAAGREAARQVFLRLIELGEGAPDTARRVLLGDLRALSDYPQRIDAVIDSFARYRLLLFDRDAQTRQPVVELAHEALLRAWPRLQQWVDDARDDLRQQRRLAGAAAQWLEGNRDPSFLLTGSRLEHAEQWADTTRIALSPVDREYLAASVIDRDRLTAEQAERDAREAALERRSMTRLRALVVTLSLGALLAGGLSVVAFLQSQRAEREARLATARQLASAAVGNLEIDAERSVLLALEAIEVTRTSDGYALREAEEALHSALARSRAVLTVPNEGGIVGWSLRPNGRSIFATSGPEDSGVVTLRDAATGEAALPPLTAPGLGQAHEVDVNDVALSADGSLLASAGDDGALRVWRTDTGELQHELRPTEEGPVWGPSFSPDRGRVAAGWRDLGLVQVLDLATGSVLEITDPIPGLEGPWEPWKTGFSADGALLAVTSCCASPVVIDLATLEVVVELQAEDVGAYEDVKFSPDGTWIATSGHDAQVWDAATGSLLFVLHGGIGGVPEVDWSQDSKRLLTAGLDGTARIWELSQNGYREVMALSSAETPGGVEGVAFSPSGDQVMTGDGTAGAVKIWDIGLSGNAELASYPATVGDWNALDALPDGGFIGSGPDGQMLIVDGSGVARPVRWSHANVVYGIVVSPDGSLVASVGDDGARVWDAVTHETVFEIDYFPAWSAWSGDSQHLALPEFLGRRVSILNRAGQQVAVFEEEAGFEVGWVAFNRDGLLAIEARPAGRPAPTDVRVSLWDWRNERVTSVLHMPSAVTGNMAFDPSGGTLATGHDNGSIVLWDVASGDQRPPIAAHSGQVWNLTFSPDGTQIASGGVDATVRLWDAASGLPQLVLDGHQHAVQLVRFSSDGTRLASISLDGSLRIWALDLDELIDIARRDVTRPLTVDECREYLHAECR